jgi:hypothetical protein
MFNFMCNKCVIYCIKLWLSIVNTIGVLFTLVLALPHEKYIPFFVTLFP